MLLNPTNVGRKNPTARLWTMVALGLALVASGCKGPKPNVHAHHQLQPADGTVLVVERTQSATAKAEEDEALHSGVNAYIYGYPLVTMEMTRRVMTNVKGPEGTHAPMGQFANQKQYPDPS